MKLFMVWYYTEKERWVEGQRTVRTAHFFGMWRKFVFLVYFCYNVLVINIDSRLPIVLFVG